jgi:esterase/lipase superfamily enzyme
MRSGRAIAGLSQGGFCSMSYGARHPDLFTVALSFSGAPDIYYDSDARAGAMALINATEVGLDHVPPDSMFGNPVSDGINWAAHDPATLAENLRSTRMYLYWGNGQPGPYDTSSSPASRDPVESSVWRDNSDFEVRLRAIGLPAHFDYYGNGTHTWPYWARDLRWSIRPLMADFKHPGPAPSEVTYSSADDRYSVYGWMVGMHRTAREFSTLQHATRGGFALAGSGSATVLTPAVYSRQARYRVTLSGSHAHDTFVLGPRTDRRIEIEVPLGPANPFQQYTALAALAGTHVYTTEVRITRIHG